MNLEKPRRQFQQSSVTRRRMLFPRPGSIEGKGEALYDAPAVAPRIKDITLHQQRFRVSDELVGSTGHLREQYRKACRRLRLSLAW